MHPSPKLIAGALASTLAAPALADEPVEIRFAGEFAGNPFSCAQAYDGIGRTASTVEVADYRLYVSNLRLLTADGGEVPVVLDQDGIWQSGDVALLDFEDGAGACVNGTPPTNMTVRGTAPAGDYAGIAFDVGVPFAQNHVDPTLEGSPMNLTAMFWNWQGGYKFLKLDLATAGQPLAAPQEAEDHAGDGASGEAARGWSLHLGSTGCASSSRTTPPSSPCAAPNHVPVRFEGFDPASHVVVVDPARVLVDADVDTNAPDTSPGCMSFPGDADCLTVMARLGLAYDGVPAGEQALVSMR
ncbi:MAG: MbnP family copper-binding protein [Pseudomonadota bacterium]